jgi:hypothetical protein
MPSVSEKQRRAAFAAMTVKRGKKMVGGKDYGKKKGGSSAVKAGKQRLPSTQMAMMPEDKLRHFTKKGKKSKK